MEGHAIQCVERYCELANRTPASLKPTETPCIDDHQIKPEDFEVVGELASICARVVLKCLYLARIGRPDLLWTVNILARAVTKWTKACDKRLEKLISYIWHTRDYIQTCYVGNTAEERSLGIFQDASFAGDLKDPKSTSG